MDRQLTEDEKKLLITSKERDILEHSIGLEKVKREGNKILSRNRFVTDKNGDDYKIIKGLVERNLMEEGPTPLVYGGMTIFWVTDLGKKSIGAEEYLEQD